MTTSHYGLSVQTIAIVGLPDKEVSEARERVRSELIASGLALPARRITVNPTPADLPKERQPYDLPIALGVIAAISPVLSTVLPCSASLGSMGGSWPASDVRCEFARRGSDLIRRFRSWGGS